MASPLFPRCGFVDGKVSVLHSRAGVRRRTTGSPASKQAEIFRQRLLWGRLVIFLLVTAFRSSDRLDTGFDRSAVLRLGFLSLFSFFLFSLFNRLYPPVN